MIYMYWVATILIFVVVTQTVSQAFLILTMRRQRRAANAALASVQEWRKIAADWETAANCWKESSERNARTLESALETTQKWREMWEKRFPGQDAANVVTFPVKH